MNNRKPKTQSLKVDYLARVEGEGGLVVKVQDKTVKDVKLKIFEPPRFFEAFLRGRHFSEAPDITARICGICPIAYQMSSVHAMEDAFGIEIPEQLAQLRRLIYCGEWIESHVLHIYMLHAPDFLGFPDAIQMAKKYPEQVQTALRLKRTGNDLVALLAGREIHPINVRVGGFYKMPRKKDLETMIEPLKWALDAAIDTARFTSTLEFPDFERDYLFVAMHHPSEYPFNRGRLVSNRGLDIAVREYDHHFFEEHVAHTTALQSVHNGHGEYFVGPLARFNLNFDQLTPLARQVAQDIGFVPPVSNPFKSIIARAVETVFAIEEALRIIEEYDMPEKPAVAIEPRAGTGYGCSEAPRGILYHRYKLSNNGHILDAKIVPPTSQNQKSIEQDLHHLVQKFIDLPKDALTYQCEQAVRNYDPCISCSVHFLKLEFVGD